MSVSLRAVVDTNVWISAVLFGGVPYRILRAWREDRFVVLFTAETYDELKPRLLEEAAAFHVQLDDANEWLRYILESAMFGPPSGVGKGKSRDPDDDKFLDAALPGNATHLVTGDKDLLSLGRFESVTILSPRDFLTLLQAEE